MLYWQAIQQLKAQKAAQAAQAQQEQAMAAGMVNAARPQAPGGGAPKNMPSAPAPPQ
jgi:hypothetical protein